VLKSDALFVEATNPIRDVVRDTQEIDDNMDVTQLTVHGSSHSSRSSLHSATTKTKSIHIMYMFSEAGETCQMPILQHHETFMLLIQAISECTAYPNLEVVGLTSPFWYHLARPTPGQAAQGARCLPADLQDAVRHPR